MRMMMTGAAFAALMLAACNPQENAQEPGDPAPPNPTQTVAAPAEKPVYRFKIGALDAIALFDGENPVKNDNQTFGVGLTPQAVAAPLTTAGQPADPIMLEIHPLLVRNGGRTMLFDTGLGEGKGQLMDSLQKAGVDPASITDVLISHGHPDHVGGLIRNGGLAFPNAAIRMSQAASLWTSNACRTRWLEPRSTHRRQMASRRGSRKSLMHCGRRGHRLGRADHAGDGAVCAPRMCAAIMPGFMHSRRVVHA